MPRRSQQPSLFDDALPPLEPHRLSPEQFRRNAKFWHGSYSPAGTVPVSHPQAAVGGVHAGTKRAAMDRLDDNGVFRDDKILPALRDPVLEARKAAGADDARLAGFLHPVIPEQGSVKGRLNEDAVLNDWQVALAKRQGDKPWHVGIADIKTGARYTNEYEHPGSTSVVIPVRAKAFYGDYVESAVRDGRAHEVHPRAMDAYLRGGRAEVNRLVSDRYDLSPETGPINWSDNDERRRLLTEYSDYKKQNRVDRANAVPPGTQALPGF